MISASRRQDGKSARPSLRVGCQGILVPSQELPDLPAALGSRRLFYSNVINITKGRELNIFSCLPLESFALLQVAPTALSLEPVSAGLIRFTESLKGKFLPKRAHRGLERCSQPPCGISSPYVVPDGFFHAIPSSLL